MISPRLRPHDLTVHGDGSASLRSDERRVVDVGREELEFITQLDGSPLDQVLRRYRHATGRFAPFAAVRLLARLHQASLLEGAGLSTQLGHRPPKRQGFTVPRWRGYGLGLGILALAGLLAAWPFSDRALWLVPRGAEWLLLETVLAVMLLRSLRNVLHALAVASVGRQPVLSGDPGGIAVDLEDVHMADRGERGRAWALCLLADAAIALGAIGAFNLWPLSALQVWCWGGVIMLLADLCPLFASPLAELVAAWSGLTTWRGHVRAYLRRLLSKPGRAFKEELWVAGGAVWSLLWVAAALQVVLVLLEQETALLAAALSSRSTFDFWLAFAPAGVPLLLLLAVAAALFVASGSLLAPLLLPAPRVSSAGVPESELAGTALAGCPGATLETVPAGARARVGERLRLVLSGEGELLIGQASGLLQPCSRLQPGDEVGAPSRYLVLVARTPMRLASWKEGAVESELLAARAVVHQAHLFADLPWPALLPLLAGMEVQEMEAGTVLAAGAVYVLLRGTVDRAGATVEAPACFGGETLFATGVAGTVQTRARLLRLSQDRLLRFLAEHAAMVLA
ncbi:MAG: hypothetical protein ACYCW6_05640 [Candidatus Xenobia bacterium]